MNHARTTLEKTKQARRHSSVDNNDRKELELLSARTLLSKCRAGCAAANILPPQAGPPNLGLLRSPAADHGPQQLIGSGDGSSALALS